MRISQTDAREIAAKSPLSQKGIQSHRSESFH